NRIDRNVILISLLNSTFPFSFEVLSTFGKYFKVQDIINSEAVKKPIAGKYGGNRATENGMYSVIPMFLEANFFSRPKTGVYLFKNKLKTTSLISNEIYKQSFRINRQSIASPGLLNQEPYFVFLD